MWLSLRHRPGLTWASIRRASRSDDRTDYVFVGAAVVAVIVLLLWALLA